MSYEDDIVIDEKALDVEFLDHPRRVLVYCEMAARAHLKEDIAEEKLNYTRAKLSREIRNSPGSFGIDEKARVTEGSIESALLVHPDYRSVLSNYNQAKYEHQLAVGIVKAFDHRKSALENLVRLHGQSYFAGPKVPHNLTEARQARDQDAQSKIRMNRRS